MTDNHPITPPPELLKQWEEVWFTRCYTRINFDELILEVFRAGADQELEACCEVLNEHNPSAYWGELLRSRRRPKPPSLKEQALKVLSETELRHEWTIADEDIIRRALESITEPEGK